MLFYEIESTTVTLLPHSYCLYQWFDLEHTPKKNRFNILKIISFKSELSYQDQTVIFDTGSVILFIFPYIFFFDLTILLIIRY